MEPATLAALGAAVVAALKEKAIGAAGDMVLNAAKYQAHRLRGVLKARSEKEFAEQVVAHVLAESAQWAPDDAVRVVALGSTDNDPDGSIGIHPPDGSLRLSFLWVNRADFAVGIRDMRVSARVAGAVPEYEGGRGDEFQLTPRGETSFGIELRLRRGVQPPVVDNGCAACDITVGALVAGPWQDEPQQTRELFAGSIWVPVFDTQRPALTSSTDIDNAIDDWITRAWPTLPKLVRLADLERELAIPPGTVKAHLPGVADRRGCEINVGETTVKVRRKPWTPTPRVSRSRRWDGW